MEECFDRLSTNGKNKILLFNPIALRLSTSLRTGLSKGS